MGRYSSWGIRTTQPFARSSIAILSGPVRSTRVACRTSAALSRRIAMAQKTDRQQDILDLVRSRSIASQEELRQLLLERGWDVTQSTLSRDMKELRLARIQTPGGPRYSAPAAENERSTSLAAVLPQLFVRLDGVGVLLILKTTAGSAQAAGAFLDAEQSPDIVGTLAGDDTVLIVCRSEVARERLGRRLLQLARG
jgi:transcriptional regulator of arginine metabolism